jgi:hypothetical protein
MAVSAFEEGIAIQLAEAGRNAIEDAVNQLTPPAFVVVFARTVDWRARRRLFPAFGKRRVERRSPIRSAT